MKQYHPVVEKCLVSHIEKHLEDKALSMEELKEWFDKILLNKDDEKVQEALEETLKWPFYRERVALKFFILYYMGISGGIYAEGFDKIVESVANEEVSESVRKNVTRYLRGCLAAEDVIIVEMRSDAKKYGLKILESEEAE